MKRCGLRLLVFAAALAWFCPALPAMAQVNYYNVDQNKKKPLPQPAPAPARAANDDTAETGSADDADDSTGKGPQIYPAQSSVVTSPQACLDQLDPAEAAEVRRDYAQSYQECQARLADKRAKKKQYKAEASRPPAAENARNFVRVRKPPGGEPPDDGAGVAPADAAAVAGARDTTTPPALSGSWSATINPDKSKIKSSP